MTVALIIDDGRSLKAMAGLATMALSGNAWGTREPFLLAEFAETGAETAE
jgi:hypothetical protein